MTTKLYEVAITYNVMIAADDCNDAINIAKKYEKTIVNSCEPTDFEICDYITKMSQLVIGWEDVVPYGYSNGRTCKQILAENDENEKKKYIESLTDEQKVQLLSTLTLSDIANLLNKKDT
jgi:Mg/Co/Ni transporter MgtE